MATGVSENAQPEVSPPQPTDKIHHTTRVVKSSIGGKMATTKRKQTGGRPTFRGSREIVTINIKNTNRLGIRDPAEDESFPVHKSFLCTYSPYFDAAFNGKSIEATTHQMELEANVHTFDIFLNWIHQQKLIDRTESTLPIDCLVNLWLLADKLLIPQLQNLCMKSMQNADLHVGNIDFPLGVHIYANTGDNSPLRFIFIDRYVRYSPSANDVKEGLGHPDILVDMFETLARVRGVLNLDTQDPTQISLKGRGAKAYLVPIPKPPASNRSSENED